MNLPFDEVMVHQDGGCTMVGDCRYFPIAIITIDGQPTDGSIDFLFVQWRETVTDYAHSIGVKAAVIVQVTKLRPPTATVRKRAGEYAAKDGSTPGLLSTNIVVRNPMLRGVITAIVWIAGSDNAPVTYSGTVAQAIRTSCGVLEAAGITPPEIDADTYETPSAGRRG